MKKDLWFLIVLVSLAFGSCSDDDNDSTNKIKQIEKDIVGIWIPNPSPNNLMDFAPVVFYFNKDKTGSVHQIISFINNSYELSEGQKFKNIRFEEYLPEQTHGQIHKFIYENLENGKLGEYIVNYVSSDSLSIQFSKSEAFKKVSSINVK